MLGALGFSDKTGRADVFCRNMSQYIRWKFAVFPTKQVARGRFVGKSWLLCAESSRIFRQIRSRGDVLSEYEPVYSLEVRCFSDKNRSHGGGLSELVGGFVLKARSFSDKTGRDEVFCRNELAVLCCELWDFPTKQVAMKRFVGKSWLLCAENSRILRQNRSR